MNSTTLCELQCVNSKKENTLKTKEAIRRKLGK